MIDWHCHILPGLDDGPATMDEAITMAAALSKAGFTMAYCTPHLIRGSFTAENETVRKTVAALQEELDHRRIELRLFPGREYYLDEFLADYLKDPLPLGDTRFLLIEIPGHMSRDFVKETCFRIKCGGYIPMIAHPERCALFDAEASGKKNRHNNLASYLGSLLNGKNPLRETQHAPDDDVPLLSYLKDLGCAFQGNRGSLGGMYGAHVRKKAEYLSRRGWITHWGTDLHDLGQADTILRVTLENLTTGCIEQRASV